MMILYAHFGCFFLNLQEQEQKYEQIQDEKFASHEIEDRFNRQRKNMPKNFTFQDTLSHLNVNKTWG